MPENQTQEEFLKDLNPDVKPDVFSEPLPTDGEPQKPAEEPEEDKEEARNRRERRLQAKLQAERESGIAMASRIATLTEVQKLRAEEPEEYLKQVERIYGTQTPEATEATELLKTALKNVKEQATEDALTKLREEQRQEREAVVNEEKSLDEMVERIEDETGKAMDDQTKQGFFQLLEKLSPKDRDGNIIEYADADAVWDELQARKVPQPNRSKDLASRSMVRTGASPSTSVGADSNERWLRENGII